MELQGRDSDGTLPDIHYDVVIVTDDEKIMHFAYQSISMRACIDLQSPMLLYRNVP